jgi:hypothetical protein
MELVSSMANSVKTSPLRELSDDLFFKTNQSTPATRHKMANKIRFLRVIIMAYKNEEI